MVRGRPISLFKFPAVAETRLPGMPENGREGVLGRRLAHGARNPDDGRRRRVLAQKRPTCEPLQRLQGVVHDEGRHVEPAGRHRSHRAAQVRLGGEVRAVGPAAQGEEQVPFAHLAGIGRGPTYEGVYVRGLELCAHSPRSL